jgi:ribokinase
LLNVAPATRLPEEVFDSLDHLHVNESEAALLTGIPANQIKQRRDEVVAYFHSRGVKNVVITMGEKGVYWSGPNGVNALIDIIKCRAVDTTAAGDTFAGAYVAWLASQGKDDVLGALHFANRAAGLSVQRPGAQASMPFLAEVESLSD